MVPNGDEKRAKGCEKEAKWNQKGSEREPAKEPKGIRRSIKVYPNIESKYTSKSTPPKHEFLMHFDTEQVQDFDGIRMSCLRKNGIIQKMRNTADPYIHAVEYVSPN